ncbi:MAG: hypothetical protein FWE44_05830 [Defluviitaleaceae bacterium]|nr:hypothetical protein [Defluviitaleaceae bacterium]
MKKTKRNFFVGLLTFILTLAVVAPMSAEVLVYDEPHICDDYCLTDGHFSVDGYYT